MEDPIDESNASSTSIPSNNSLISESDMKSEYYFKKMVFQEINSISEIKPKPRSGHRIVYYKGRIFSFGGYNPSIDQNDPDMLNDIFWAESKPLLKELWELNLSTGLWSKCRMRGEVPEQLASHTAVVHPLDEGTMLVYGGTGAPFGLTTSNTVVSCHLESQIFRQIELDESDYGQNWPMPLYGQAVITDSSRLFTVGGTSGFTYFMDVHMLDFSCYPPKWHCLYKLSGVREEPEPRYRHELALWQNKLYVLGGGTSFSADRFEDLPTFDISQKKWYYTRTKSDPTATIDNSDDGYPEARRCHSAIQIGEIVWIFGGYDGEEVFGDIWRLNMITFQWTKIQIDLPLPVYFHAMTASNEGKMIMFGGVDDYEKNTRTSRVFTCWLTVPSLRTMSWEAVCHYLPQLPAASQLIEEGVPRDCVELLSSCVQDFSGDADTSHAIWG